jgi:hypothetical protein
MAAHIVAQSGKSMTSKTGAAIGSKVQSSITRRQVGKKEQRPSNGEASMHNQQARICN